MFKTTNLESCLLSILRVKRLKFGALKPSAYLLKRPDVPFHSSSNSPITFWNLYSLSRLNILTWYLECSWIRFFSVIRRNKESLYFKYFRTLDLGCILFGGVFGMFASLTHYLIWCSISRGFGVLGFWGFGVLGFWLFLCSSFLLV